MFDLGKFLKGAVAQINPWDGGATFHSVMSAPSPKPKPAPAVNTAYHEPVQPMAVVAPRPAGSTAYRPLINDYGQGQDLSAPGLFKYRPQPTQVETPQTDWNAVGKGILNIVPEAAHVIRNTENVIGRNIGQIPQRIVEGINPNDSESKADVILNKAAQKYKFTPSFQNELHGANPDLVNNLHSSGVDKGLQIEGTHTPDVLHRILIGKDDQLETLRHEGLHDVYATLPHSTRANFLDMVNKANLSLPDTLGKANSKGEQDVTKEGLQTYLLKSLDGYKALPNNFTDMRQLPTSIQNEIHSYVPNYFDVNHIKMPKNLADYYANYYNTGGQPTHIDRISPLQKLFGEIFN